MINVVPMKAEHMNYLLKQDLTRKLRDSISDSHVGSLVGYPHSFAALDEEGKVLACAGLIHYWAGRAEAWAIIDLNRRDKFLFVHRAVKRFLDKSEVRRIEAVVDVEYQEGHRWIKLLGFSREAKTLEGYRPDGGDCSLYARIRRTPWQL